MKFWSDRELIAYEKLLARGAKDFNAEEIQEIHRAAKNDDWELITTALIHGYMKGYRRARRELRKK